MLAFFKKGSCRQMQSYIYIYMETSTVCWLILLIVCIAMHISDTNVTMERWACNERYIYFVGCATSGLPLVIPLVVLSISVAVLDEYTILATLHPSSPGAFWDQPFFGFFDQANADLSWVKQFAACGTVSPMWLFFASCASQLWLVVVQALWLEVFFQACYCYRLLAISSPKWLIFGIASMIL